MADNSLRSGVRIGDRVRFRTPHPIDSRYHWMVVDIEGGIVTMATAAPTQIDGKPAPRRVLEQATLASLIERIA
jgi:hypothetical protein